MAARSPVRRRLSGTVAAIERHNGPDDPRLEPLRADLHTARLEELRDRIKADADSLPELTDDQLSKLVVLLRGGRSA